MAVAENGGAKVDSSAKNLDNTMVSSDSNGTKDLEPTSEDQNSNGSQGRAVGTVPADGGAQVNQIRNGFHGNGLKGQQMVPSSGVYGSRQMANGDDNFNRDMMDLQELLSKLNPMAAEFVPHSLLNNNHGSYTGNGFPYPNGFLVQTNYETGNVNGRGNGHPARKKKNNYGHGRRRMNSKISQVQQEEVIRRTVYVSDIDQQVTEEQLAALFNSCGQVVDCRICGDPNSILRFAFVEFTDDEGARSALSLAGTVLGFYPLRVLPSKTAIAPVNPIFLPRDEDERAMCSRTIYCTNVDKRVTQADLKLFFESICGEVYRLRLLGDSHHSTRIAFVEFVMAESAIAALNCSGAILGSSPIRVSPSKTPVRPRVPRPALQ